MKFVAVFLLSIVCTIVLGFLRLPSLDLGIDYSSLVGYFLYSSLTVFCIYYFGKSVSVFTLVFLLLGGEYLVHSQAILNFFYGKLYYLPQLLIHTVAIVTAAVAFTIRKSFSFLPSLAGMVLTIAMFLVGFQYWIHFLNFGTFFGGVVPYKVNVQFRGAIKGTEKFEPSDIVGKVVLMDFWTTTCGVCFKKFPRLEEINRRWASGPKLLIISVNRPVEEDLPGQAEKAIRDIGYSFPVLVLDDPDLPELIGVQVYPTTLVFDRKGNVIFKGDIELAEKVFVNELNLDR